jgi:hypothetical protein
VTLTPKPNDPTLKESSSNNAPGIITMPSTVLGAGLVMTFFYEARSSLRALTIGEPLS